MYLSGIFSMYRYHIGSKQIQHQTLSVPKQITVSHRCYFKTHENYVKCCDCCDRYLQNILSKTKGYSFFSAPHSTFSKTDHIFGHKTGLNRFKKIEIISCILLDHHRLRLVFNNNKNNRKPTYMWKLNNFLVSDIMVKEERKKEI